MSNKLIIQDENIGHLAEEIRAIVSQARDAATIEMISAKYQVGEAIATSPLFKKYARTQGELYEVVAQEAGMRPDTITDCVKLYEKYPKEKPKELAEMLYEEHGAWRNVRLALYGEILTRSEQPKCRHCELVDDAFRGEELIWGDWDAIKKQLHKLST